MLKGRVTAGLVVGVLLSGCGPATDGPPIGGETTPASGTETPDQGESPGHTPESPHPTEAWATEHFPSASECPAFAPEVLPSGAPAGESRPFPEDAPREFQVAWGEGRDRVILRWGEELFDDTGMGFYAGHFPSWDEFVVERDGVERVIIPGAELPWGSSAIEFLLEGCPYRLWLAGGGDDFGQDVMGYELEEVLEYAERF